MERFNNMKFSKCSHNYLIFKSRKLCVLLSLYQFNWKNQTENEDVLKNWKFDYFVQLRTLLGTGMINGEIMYWSIGV